MGFSDQSLDQLRAAIDITDLLTHYGTEVDSHRKAICLFHDEQTASMSVDTENGLYHCFGCGIEGDAFDLVMQREQLRWVDAAKWLADRYRVDLQHGDRTMPPPPRPWIVANSPSVTAATNGTAPAPQQPTGHQWTQAQIDRVHELRGWTFEAVSRLGLTIVGDRVAIPITDGQGTPTGRLRYQPNPDRRGKDQPKMLADKGTPRALFPAPERISGDPLWILEGEPDAITAQSVGLPATGIPGTQGWKTDWAPRFQGRGVVICTDCDQPGRDLAQRVATDLEPYAREIRVLDLDPARGDAYDLTDAALEHRGQYGGLRADLYQRIEALTPVKAADQGALLAGQRLEAWQSIMLPRVRGELPPESAAIPLPFPELNEATNGGVRPGEVFIIAGYTGHAKSVMADMCLDTATERGRSGHLYMTEMSLGDRGDRYLARNSGVKFSRIRKGNLDSHDRDLCEMAIENMRWPAILVNSWTPQQVCEDIVRGGWGMAVIDHLHDFHYRDEADLRLICQAFKDTAKQSTEHGPGTCIILVAQLNDGQMSGSKTNARPEPGPHSLKGTTAIRQIADEIIFTWMVDDDLGRATTGGKVWTAKGRNNGLGCVNVTLDPERMLLEADSQWRGVASDDWEAEAAT